MKMRLFSYIIGLCLAFCLAACQSEDSLNNSAVGYLYLEASANTALSTKSAVPENYKPKQLHAEIRNAQNVAVYQTDDYDAEWQGKQFALPAGSYTIVAHSHGFNGQASGFDNPYYYGTTTTTITAGQKATASVTCTLANVKVSVQFDDAFKKAFQTAKVTVASQVSGIAPQEVEMGRDIKPIYVPVGTIKAMVSVENKSSQTVSMEKVITEVKARDHYILKYKVKQQGNGSITVEADATERQYTFNFMVPTTAATTLQANAANAWSNFALLEGEVPSSEGELDAAAMRFEWKKSTESSWQKQSATPNSTKYTAKLTGLTPNTAYTYRMVYEKDGQSYTSKEISFTTEAQTALPNGKLDDWYQSGNTWYAISETDFKAGRKFWDSSNPGSTTGAGALVNVNPTTGNSAVVRTAGGQSAQMKSQFASAFGIGKFAAASLYAGSFKELVGADGAKINFGQPFTARPTQLTGWYQFSTGKIDYCGENQPANTVKKGDTDLWSAYVVLTTGTYELDNTKMNETSKDFNALLHNDKDDFVVAYGALPDAECIASSSWKKFTVDLVYKNLEKKPTHIIIVFSSSKYGDYFTGSTQSLLYLDDLELVYGDSPQTK